MSKNLKWECEHLQRIAELSIEMAKNVVWIRTTDAVEEIHNSRSKQFYRFHNDVLCYNEAADEIFSRLGVPLINLYSFSKVFGHAAYCDHD